MGCKFILNNALSILESIRKNIGIEAFDNIIKACGTLEVKSTLYKQSKYVKAVLNELDNAYGTDAVKKAMMPCGHQCISDGVILKAKKIYKKSGNLNDFLRLMNEQHIGGSKLHVKDGNIIGIYEKCYCSLARQAKDITSTYCYCSAGWYQRLFSSVFEKYVTVVKKQTILEGYDRCVFEIVF